VPSHALLLGRELVLVRSVAPSTVNNSETTMTNKFALTAVFLFVSLGLVKAAPIMPSLSGATQQSSEIRNAAWQCGPRRCVWVPNYRGPIPDYARAWGAPTLPHCYWKRGVLGKWKYKCDDD
jgi:hypothetical protein